MTQEFVTLPRAVVEQAIAALTDLAGWRAAPLCNLLRAALEQPQDGLPLVIAGAIFDFAGYLTTRPRVIEVGSTANASPIADLVKEFAKLRGLSLADAAVLSWQEWLKSASQEPQGEQEPFTVLVRKHSWLENQWEAAPRGFPDYGKQWADERINVYTHPQPKREPLTDEQIEKICPSFDDPMRREMWKIGFKAAHNIK